MLQFSCRERASTEAMLHTVHHDVVARRSASVVVDARKVQAHSARGEAQRAARDGRATTPRSARRSGTRSEIASHWRRG